MKTIFNFEGNVDLKELNLEFSEFGLTIYPNPLEDKTNINFNLANSSELSIKVFDITGKVVEVLIDENKQEGNHSVIWNASQFDNGVY